METDKARKSDMRADRGSCSFSFPRVEGGKKTLLSESLKDYPFTIFQPVTKENSQIRFRSSVDWNCPELSPHAQVLSNYSHQRHAGYVDEPPGQGSWKMSVIYPAADHVEEVHGDREVQALFPSADEEPQTKGAAGTVTRKRCQSLSITVH